MPAVYDRPEAATAVVPDPDIDPDTSIEPVTTIDADTKIETMALGSVTADPIRVHFA